MLSLNWHEGCEFNETTVNRLILNLVMPWINEYLQELTPTLRHRKRSLRASEGGNVNLILKQTYLSICISVWPPF